MVDSTFLSTYKGSLYPVPLGAPVGEEPCLSSGPATLVDLCSDMIVQDSTWTLQSLDVVPAGVYYNLMRAALASAKDRAIEVLISRWPWRVLNLSRLAPPLFDSVRALHDENYVKEHMRRGVKFTTCLAHTFVECLKKRTPTKLQYLDMAGYPTAEVIVNYLSSHVLLVSNETRQKEIITMYNEVAQYLPNSQHHSYELDTTLPENCFVVSLDACVQTQDMELCRALKTCNESHCQFRIRPRRLDLSCVGVARICVLLEQVDAQYLSGLCLKFNALHNEVLPVLVPAIQPLTNLTCLDLGCNDLRVTLSDDAAGHLNHLLSSLPQLERLDLSNNALRYQVQTLLKGIQKPLRFLRLCACLLSEADMQYLACSHHISALQELDLSENSIGSFYDATAEFIVNTSGQLAVLELENCRLLEHQLQHFLSTVCPKLGELQYLNVCRNKSLSQGILVPSLPTLTEMSMLNAFKLSYPLECYLTHGGDVESAMDGFQTHMNLLLQALALRVGRTSVELVMECS